MTRPSGLPRLRSSATRSRQRAPSLPGGRCPITCRARPSHPGPCTCPSCGGALRRIGEDVTETLDYVPGRFKVVRHVREAFSCRACESVVQAPAPDHAIARGRAGAGLLAHIVVAKSTTTCPCIVRPRSTPGKALLETSTLSGWVGATAAALAPLVDPLPAQVIADGALHGDDTPVPVLAPGAGKTKTGRLWTYVRDERPIAASVRRPRVLLFARPQRRASSLASADFRGVLHADGYAGFNGLYAGGRIIEAACWAHVRRKFFDVHAATDSPVAKEALDRIGQLYRVEETINGALPDDRRRERQQRSRPIADVLRAWAEETTRKLSRKSELAAAFRYMRSRWTALTRVSTTAASRSTTTRPNARCAASQSAARIISSPAPMPAAGAPRPSTG